MLACRGGLWILFDCSIIVFSYCVVTTIIAVEVVAVEVASCFPFSRGMCLSPVCYGTVWGRVALARAGGGGVCGVAGHHSGQGGGIWSAEEVDIRHPLLW